MKVGWVGLGSWDTSHLLKNKIGREIIMRLGRDDNGNNNIVHFGKVINSFLGGHYFKLLLAALGE